MELSQVKVGQTVKLARADNLFYHFYIGAVGVVTEVDGHHVHVRFTEGEHEGKTDYGRADGLDLVVVVEDVAPATVKQAIAKVESALAELKALVG